MIVFFRDEINDKILDFLIKSRISYKIIESLNEIDNFCIIVTNKRKDFFKIRRILSVIRYNEIKIKKWDIRFKIWRKMMEQGVARSPFPIFGRIPNFYGAELAARNLLKIKEFRNATSILVNPDSPQRPVRELVLSMGKTLIVPTPKLKKGYLLIESPGNIKEASTIKGIFKYGKPVKEFYVDFVVEGSVAVDLNGNRLGKGSGFGDAEIKMAKRKNKNVKVATTVHDIQIVDEIPREPHDERINYIVTPTQVISI